MNIEDNQLNDDSQSQLLNSALSLGGEIDQLIVECLSSRTLTQCDDEEQCILSMLARCQNFFRAVLLLSKEQLVHPTAACVRSLIEQRWVLESVANKPTRKEAIRWLVEHNEHNRKHSLDNLRTLPLDERDPRITDESLIEVEVELGITKKHPSKSWAKLANRNTEYLTAYALLCDQIHPSLSALEDHLLFDSDGRLHSLTANAGLQFLPLHLIQACEVMIDVIAAYSGVWHTEELVSHATDLRHRLSALWERVYDPLSLRSQSTHHIR